MLVDTVEHTDIRNFQLCGVFCCCRSQMVMLELVVLRKQLGKAKLASGAKGGQLKASYAYDTDRKYMMAFADLKP